MMPPRPALRRRTCPRAASGDLAPGTGEPGSSSACPPGRAAAACRGRHAARAPWRRRPRALGRPAGEGRPPAPPCWRHWRGSRPNLRRQASRSPPRWHRPAQAEHGDEDEQELRGVAEETASSANDAGSVSATASAPARKCASPARHATTCPVLRKTSTSAAAYGTSRTICVSHWRGRAPGVQPRWCRALHTAPIRRPGAAATSGATAGSNSCHAAVMNGSLARGPARPWPASSRAIS